MERFFVGPQAVDDVERGSETRRSGGLEAVLAGLRRAANYSVRLRARTAAGAGPPAAPVYCATHEDSQYQYYITLLTLISRQACNTVLAPSTVSLTKTISLEYNILHTTYLHNGLLAEKTKV